MELLTPSFHQTSQKGQPRPSLADPRTHQLSSIDPSMPIRLSSIPHTGHLQLMNSQSFDYKRVSQLVSTTTPYRVMGRTERHGNWVIGPKQTKNCSNNYIRPSPILDDPATLEMVDLKVTQPMGLPIALRDYMTIIDVAESVDKLKASGFIDEFQKAMNTCPIKNTADLTKIILKAEDSSQMAQFETEILETYGKRFPEALLVKESPVLRFTAGGTGNGYNKVHLDCTAPHKGLEFLLQSGYSANQRSRMHKKVDFRRTLGEPTFNKLLDVAKDPTAKVIPLSIWVYLKGNEETTLNVLDPAGKYSYRAGNMGGTPVSFRQKTRMWALENTPGMAVAMDSSRVPHFASPGDHPDTLRISVEVRAYAVSL